MKIRTAADLEAKKQAGLRKLQPGKPRIAVGLATCGKAVGGAKVYERLHEIIGTESPEIDLSLVASATAVKNRLSTSRSRENRS